VPSTNFFSDVRRLISVLQVKLGLYFNVLREAESIKAAGYDLFKKYHAFLYNQEVYYRVHSPPLDVALNNCFI
jgi:hypothetical protein